MAKHENDALECHYAVLRDSGEDKTWKPRQIPYDCRTRVKSPGDNICSMFMAHFSTP